MDSVFKGRADSTGTGEHETQITLLFFRSRAGLFQAIPLHLKAVDQSLANAQFSIAVLYEEGNLSDTRARELYPKAAGQCFADAYDDVDIPRARMCHDPELLQGKVMLTRSLLLASYTSKVTE
ncbi:hypothetical protein BGZ95_003758 [Linnemannia exigua]|uniref:Uncharacterized protein n=1 Tax=Linnemannia exigua TaxID=604196 RepID=A0AAD4DHX4_9FUNG|nr:hypothetical protein BGZ95_003758 [Linnemannia exigua]